MLSLASLHCPSCPLDLLSLSPAHLVEHGQQDDRAVVSHEVRDPLPCPPEVEAQLPKPSVQLAGVRRAERRPEVGEPVDVEPHLTEVVFGQLVEPVGHLRLQLDLPRHNVNGIYPKRYTQARDAATNVAGVLGERLTADEEEAVSNRVRELDPNEFGGIAVDIGGRVVVAIAPGDSETYVEQIDDVLGRPGWRRA